MIEKDETSLRTSEETSEKTAKWTQFKLNEEEIKEMKSKRARGKKRMRKMLSQQSRNSQQWIKKFEIRENHWQITNEHREELGSMVNKDVRSTW